MLWTACLPHYLEIREFAELDKSDVSQYAEFINGCVV